ncbi:hypothetical protein LZP73_15680 [Shewanella sp. AS16]|uniref:hypothetical protein n=1 Tax=Shewanella sp. AS16 TaxID=2907625 RepID=UPI001F45FD5F|nr:hypothetical protein [Shewanella sp. AS16]MCE9687628.1 hypothetical protein [Shewanella sp. AS16]
MNESNQRILLASHPDGKPTLENFKIDSTPVAEPKDGVMRDVLSRSLLIRGFIQREFVDQRPEFYRQMAAWIASGQIRYREDIADGLASVPEAFIGLLQGNNFGKLVIRVAE